MTNFPSGHPDEGSMLAYLDGELPPEKAREVRRHLEACWQCRAELAKFESTVADCVRYRRDVLEEHLPPPPHPWPDLYREFARMDAAGGGDRWLASLLRPLPTVPLRWVAATVAIILASGAILHQLRETPSVQAAALLEKAAAIAKSQPLAPRRIRIRTKSRQIVRVIGMGERRPGSLPASAGQTAEGAPEIEALFEAAHYDWEDPLSAKSYQAWRNGLAGKERDEVSTVPDPQSPAESCYQIRTVAETGGLASASLTLRATDLRPLVGKLEFRNREWVELSDLPEPSAGGENIATNSVEVPVRPAEPSRPAATAPGPTASISDELQVLSALHRIGADLGDPVEVALAGGRVVVSGVGVPPQRQKQIQGALEQTPNVLVEFREPGAAPLPDGPAPSGAISRGPSSTAPASGIEARLERYLGGRAEFEKFSSQILEWNEAAMPRAYALRALAQRFSAAKEAGLGAKDRRLLREMGREHATAMARPVGAIHQTLSPMLVALGGSAGPRRAAARAAGWQPAAEELFRASRRVEVLLSVIVGLTPDDGSTANLPTELLAAIDDLQADLDECQRLLSQDAGG